MISEEDLMAAAVTIRHMSKIELGQRLSQLEAERQRRTDFSAATQDTDFDSTQLDEAAYRLACQYRAEGKLTEAARWYRTAALNDYADAALQLGYVLESLAERYIENPGTPQVLRDELMLVEDASHWYLEALSAGYFEEAAERLDSMVARHNPNRPRPAPLHPMARPDPGPEPCHQGGLQAVNKRCTVDAAARHIVHCLACQYELLARGGLLPAISVRQLDHPRTDDASPPETGKIRELFDRT
jgi:TPR repeat protein